MTSTAIEALQHADATAEWRAYAAGDRRAQDALLARYYDELRQIARRLLYRDHAALLLQPTELAHEAVLRMLKLERIAWTDCVHFLATAARVMRQVLIDEVRRAGADKRTPPAALTGWPGEPALAAVDLQALDIALSELTLISPERARVVELRFFVGLTLEEVAQVNEVSPTTVKRQWRAARAWLLERLG